MSEPAKHTPGPWEYLIDGDWPMIYSAAHDEEGYRIPVADLFHGGFDFADMGWPLEANARLIAAAPELLASVIELLGPLERASAEMVERGMALDENGEAAFDRARAAIAKARGAS